MPATQREKRPAAQEFDASAGLTDHVMKALGRPEDVYRVVVRRLWGNHYRVNVVIGKDMAATTIAHSFFVVTEDDGSVKAADPTITRRYGPPTA
jgi:hypothetical protein